MVKGADIIRAKVRRLEREFAKQARPATRAAARIVRDEARIRAVQQGARKVIARKIITRDRRRAPTTEIGFRIKTPKNDAFYLRFFEAGTQSHTIRAGAFLRTRSKTKKGLVASRGRLKGKFLGIAVFHPGLRPRPFLHPALVAKQDAASRELATVYQETLRKVARGS